MFAWEEKIEVVKSTLAIKSNKQLEEMLELSNGYIGELIKGKNKNPSKIITAMVKILHINPRWLYNESLDIFEDDNAQQQKDPEVKEKLQFLDSFNDHIINTIKKNGLDKIEERLTAIEARFEKEKTYQVITSDKDEPLYTAEPTHSYGEEEEYDNIFFVHNIAAGPPTLINDDRNETVKVPSRLLRGGEKYYAAKIQGSSMTGAGILDGDMVLIRHTDVPKDGAIQVVRYQDKVTLKRLREVEGKGWELRYMDGSGKKITCDSDEYETLGEFEAILPEKCRPGHA